MWLIMEDFEGLCRPGYQPIFTVRDETMKTLTGVIALMFALMFGTSDVAVAAQNAAAPVARERALSGPAPATGLAQACRDKRPGTVVTVGGRQTACPAPTGRFLILAKSVIQHAPDRAS
jgi:hypothetical protein